MYKVYPTSIFGKLKCLVKNILVMIAISIVFSIGYSAIYGHDPVWVFYVGFVIVILNFFNYTHKKLIIDDGGVYQLGGFYPWDNGAHGLEWEQIETAYFYDNFASWLFQSYTISLKRKFSDAHSAYFYDIHRGKTAAGEINEIIYQKLSETQTEEFAIGRGDN